LPCKTATLNGARDEQFDTPPRDKIMIKKAFVNCFMR